jgi:hypothetical protein
MARGPAQSLRAVGPGAGNGGLSSEGWPTGFPQARAPTCPRRLLLPSLGLDVGLGQKSPGHTQTRTWLALCQTAGTDGVWTGPPLLLLLDFGVKQKSVGCFGFLPSKMSGRAPEATLREMGQRKLVSAYTQHERAWVL